MIDYFNAHEQPLTDEKDISIRKRIGDAEPFVKLGVGYHFEEQLPLFKKPINLPVFKGSTNVFVIGVYQGDFRQNYQWTDMPRYHFIAKSMPWVMRSILQNTDALCYEKEIDFCFLVEKHIYDKVRYVFEACEVPEEHIILSELENPQAFQHDVPHSSNAKSHALCFSEQMKHYEQVIWHGADTFILKGDDRQESLPLFRHLIGDRAGNMEFPSWMAYCHHDEQPLQLHKDHWATETTVSIRGGQISRDAWIQIFSKSTGISLKDSERLCGTNPKAPWGCGTIPICRWPVRFWIQNHPKRVEWLQTWLQHPYIGSDPELGLFGTFFYYLQQSEGISLSDLDTQVYNMLEIEEYRMFCYGEEGFEESVANVAQSCVLSF